MNTATIYATRPPRKMHVFVRVLWDSKPNHRNKETQLNTDARANITHNKRGRGQDP